MNVPHAFSHSPFLSLSHTHEHTYVCISIYIYILIAAIYKSPIAASRNKGGDESEDNNKCNNNRRTVSTCTHHMRCQHTKKLQPAYQRV